MNSLSIAGIEVRVTAFSDAFDCRVVISLEKVTEARSTNLSPASSAICVPPHVAIWAFDAWLNHVNANLSIPNTIILFKFGISANVQTDEDTELVTSVGRTSSCKPVARNADPPNPATVEGRIKSSKAVHLLKVFSPTFVNPFGNLTYFKDVQFKKLFPSSFVMPSPRIATFRLEHPSHCVHSNLVTESGTIRTSKEDRFLKVELAIVVTSSGTMTTLALKLAGANVVPSAQ